MKNLQKPIKLLIPLCLLGLFIIFNFTVALSWFDALKKLIYPLFFAVIVALVLSIPINIFENKIFKFKKPQLNRGFSIFIVIFIALAMLAGICFLIIPEIVRSIEAIAEKLPEITKMPIDFFKNSALGQNIAKSLEKVFKNISEKLQEYLPNLVKYLSNLALSIFNFIIGIFLAVLLISNKKTLLEQKGKMEKLFHLDTNDRYLKFSKFMALAKDKFSKFLSGQLLEALIFGTFVYIGCLILKMPYALLIAFIMAVSNLIPMLGGYIGGFLSFIFIFTVSLNQALIFIVFITVAQQIEQMTTYPIIVGKNVNLSSFWVLTAVIIGGGLFGFWGLVLSVPLVATLFDFFIPIDDKMIDLKKKYNNLS